MGTIRNVPNHERPRERCLKHGASTLSARECLALVLGSGPKSVGCLGVASQLIDQLVGEVDDDQALVVIGTLLRASGQGALENISGVGPTAKAKLLAVFEIADRISRHVLQNAQAQHSSEVDFDAIAKLAIAQIPTDARTSPKEWIGFIPVFSSDKVGRLCIVERGARTHVNFDPPDLFARLLAQRPQAFFLAHNHPSDLCNASESDLHLTRVISDLASRLNTPLLGHFVVGPTKLSLIE